MLVGDCMFDSWKIYIGSYWRLLLYVIVFGLDLVVTIVYINRNLHTTLVFIHLKAEHSYLHLIRLAKQMSTHIILYFFDTTLQSNFIQKSRQFTLLTSTFWVEVFITLIQNSAQKWYWHGDSTFLSNYVSNSTARWRLKSDRFSVATKESIFVSTMFQRE